MPSLWLGEGGIALVAWLLAPSPALADRLAELAVVPEEEIVGAGHGLAGVLAQLARRPELLSHDRLLPGAVAALSATALREDGRANWPPSVTEGLVHRTGDELWLGRTRRFAMHAAAQVEADRSRHGRGRHTLWTGDLGTAMYLGACLDGGSALPAIELW